MREKKMEEPAINLPAPMTPETRKLIPGKCFDADKFLYGNNWLGPALYYKTMYSDGAYGRSVQGDGSF